MQKKIIGIVLLVCLLVSLLPMTAMAATTEKTYVKFGRVQANGSGYKWELGKGETKYLTQDTSANANGKDYFLTANGADNSNYTVKLDWPANAAKPTLYFKGAVSGGYDPVNPLYSLNGTDYSMSNIGCFIEMNCFASDDEQKNYTDVTWVCPDIVVEADSVLCAYNSVIKANGDCTVSSKNDAKLTLYHGGNAVSGSFAMLSGSLTLNNANLKLDYHQGTSGKGGIVIADGALTIKNSKLDLHTNSVSVTVTKDVLIENSTITSDCAGLGSPLIATETNMTVIGSKITANKTAPWDRGELCVGMSSGKASDPTPDVEAILTITDSEINFTGNMYGFGNYRDKKTTIILNAGTVIKMQLANVNVASSDTGYSKFMSVTPTFEAGADVSIKIGKDAASAAASDAAALTAEIDGTRTSSSKYNPNRYCEINVTKSAVAPTDPAVTDPTSPPAVSDPTVPTDPTETTEPAATTEPTATTEPDRINDAVAATDPSDPSAAPADPTGTEAPKPADEGNGLSAGVTVLIVVGAIAVLGGGGAGVWFFLKKKKAA